MDSVSEARLQLVCPVLADKIHLLAAMLEDEGIVFRVTQGLRSWADQQVLWLKGRNSSGVVINPRDVVTNAPPGHSYHEFGLAVDVVPMDQIPPKPDWDISHPVWKRLISAGQSLGLFSGSQFCSIKDYPHFQLTGVFPISPTQEVREVFLNVGLSGVWVEAGLIHNS